MVSGSVVRDNHRTVQHIKYPLTPSILLLQYLNFAFHRFGALHTGLRQAHNGAAV